MFCMLNYEAQLEEVLTICLFQNSGYWKTGDSGLWATHMQVGKPPVHQCPDCLHAHCCSLADAIPKAGSGKQHLHPCIARGTQCCVMWRVHFLFVHMPGEDASSCVHAWHSLVHLGRGQPGVRQSRDCSVPAPQCHCHWHPGAIQCSLRARQVRANVHPPAQGTTIRPAAWCS